MPPATKSRQDTVDQALQRLRDAGDQPRLNGYLHLLHAEHAWPLAALAETLGISRQAVDQRIKRSADAGEPVDLAGLPVGAPPERPAAAPRYSNVTKAGLRVPDKAAIAAQASRAARDELDAIRDPEKRLVAAAAMVDEAKAAYEAAYKDRAKAAWTLELHGDSRGAARAGCWTTAQYAAARQKALGVTHEQLAEMGPAEKAALAKEKRVWKRATAPEDLPAAGERVVAALARQRAALAVRDGLVQTMLTRDESGRVLGGTELAALIGRSRTLLSPGRGHVVP